MAAQVTSWPGTGAGRVGRGVRVCPTVNDLNLELLLLKEPGRSAIALPAAPPQYCLPSPEAGSRPRWTATPQEAP